MKRFSEQKKKQIVDDLLHSSQTQQQISGKYFISRISLSKWVKQYKTTGKLDNYYKRGVAHYRSLKPAKTERVLELVSRQPQISTRQLYTNARKAGIRIGYHGLQNFLKRQGLNLSQQRTIYTDKLPDFKRTIKKTITPDTRLACIKEIIEGTRTISSIARQTGISRPTLHAWIKRYYQGNKSPNSLSNRFRSSISHYRCVPKEVVLNVLQVVAANPDLSSVKLHRIVQQNGITLGYHGIQKLLERYNLNTLESRRIYASKFGKMPAILPPSTSIDTVSIPSLEQLSPVVLPGPPPPAIQLLPEPPDAPPPSRRFFFLASTLISFALFFGLLAIISTISSAQSVGELIGYGFAFLALTFGTFFMAYSLKYYLTIAYVLIFSRRMNELETRNNVVADGDSELSTTSVGTQSVYPLTPGQVTDERFLARKFHSGLTSDVSHITLDRHPFVSVHVPLYNEKRVVNRLLEAVTSLDYPNYEVIVCDDSTDETKDIVNEWRHHPRIKISHRETRAGFKGAALKQALSLMDPKTEFILVFDADFLPYPDSINQFLKYFKATTGSLHPQDYVKQPVAAIQGYQWHVLNKSENWVTRGVRTEYAGSYVIERSGTEIYAGLKQIAGSVYMVRADLMRHFSWGTSITEDFELTLKLYQAGYKVVYTPYIQTPSECVSTLKRLVRQRMRWAEGHSFNIKNLFKHIIISKKISVTEKLEFIYLSPYYLQSFFFLVGTFSWFLSEAVFKVKLPFWTEVWGWSLVLTNMFSLPLMNLVGLFLEEAEEKDYAGIPSFLLLTYIVAPFQAYASVKGFLEKEEGPWFRTPKTGKITDIYRRGKFYRWLSGLLPGSGRQTGVGASTSTLTKLPVLFNTANNRFNKFHIQSRKSRWIGNITFSLLVLFMTVLVTFSPLVPLVSVSEATSPKMMIKADSQELPNNPNTETLISTPKSITLNTTDGKAVEYIFHKEPRVRIKFADKEIEITTETANKLGRANPTKSIISGSRKVVYEEIFPNVDLEYQILGSELQERFILKKYVDINEVTQRVNLIDVTAASIGNTFSFFDAAGTAVYTFQEPVMYEKQHPDKQNYAITMSLKKELSGYIFKKTLTNAGKQWLIDSERNYPVVVDPAGQIVASGVIDAEVEYGSNQRKVYYNASINKYYALSADGTDPKYYYCDEDVNDCTGGAANWTAVDLDSGDADNRHPSMWYDGSVIWVIWGDDGSDTLEFRTITPVDGQTADTLGTSICTTGDILQAVTDFSTSLIGIVYAGDNTQGYIWHDAEVGLDDMKTFTKPATSCASSPSFSNLNPNGSGGIPASARTVGVPNDSSTAAITLFWQDSAASTGLQANEVSTTTWTGEFTIENVEGSSFNAVKDSSNNIWIFHANSNATNADLYKCDSQCDAAGDVHIQTDPWSSQSNLTEATITYASTPNDLILSVLKDTTNQKAYHKGWDIDTTSITDGLSVTDNGYDYGWAAGDLDHISAIYSVASSDTAAVVVGIGGASFEFATVPENSLILLIILPWLPKVFVKLRQSKLGKSADFKKSTNKFKSKEKLWLNQFT